MIDIRCPRMFASIRHRIGKGVRVLAKLVHLHALAHSSMEFGIFRYDATPMLVDREMRYSEWEAAWSERCTEEASNVAVTLRLTTKCATIQ